MEVDCGADPGDVPVAAGVFWMVQPVKSKINRKSKATDLILTSSKW
jgi:hypothetical protein